VKRWLVVDGWWLAYNQPPATSHQPLTTNHYA
jgi:hypothetical protein